MIEGCRQGFGQIHVLLQGLLQAGDAAFVNVDAEGGQEFLISRGESLPL
jgi:hypothetical protein